MDSPLRTGFLPPNDCSIHQKNDNFDDDDFFFPGVIIILKIKDDFNFIIPHWGK
jgi:hypothetical protein